jgi:hypothetical protein
MENTPTKNYDYNNHSIMDSFVADMAGIVRRLFPEDEEEEEMNARGGGACAKRKRNSIFAALSPSPLREIPNIPKSKGTDTTTRTSSTSKALSEVCGNGQRGQEDSEIKKFLFVYDDGDDEEEEVEEEDDDDGESEFDDEDDDESQSMPKSPSQTFSDRFMHVLSYYPSDSEYIVIRDAVLDTHDENMYAADPNRISLSSLTMEQVDSIRLMIVTPKRMLVMNDMGRMIFGPNFGQKNLNNGPGFWYSVLRSYFSFKQVFATEKDASRRFDLLFGFTYYLAEYPHWLTQHGRGWGGEKMVSGLAMRWKHILKLSAQELWLDEEFSLPATLCLLDEFRTMVESAEMHGDPPLRFDYN